MYIHTNRYGDPLPSYAVYVKPFLAMLFTKTCCFQMHIYFNESYNGNIETKNEDMPGNSNSYETHFSGSSVVHFGKTKKSHHCSFRKGSSPDRNITHNVLFEDLPCS